MDKIQFKALEISEEILKAVEDMGFEEATAIQTKSIPIILSGKDVIGHSQTGTGKTAAFGIPALEMIDIENSSVQVLILCPTRELAIQACEEIRKFAKYKHGVKTLPIYGGQPIDHQIKAIKRGVQIVIGTPGRIMDHMRRRTLKMGNIKMVILDEADEMLNMGFREDIETILKDIPTERQTILFSATMSKEIMRITKEYQRDPELVKVVHKKLTVPSIEQYYLEVSQTKKLEVLSRLIDMYNPKLSLVFCNTKKKVDELVSQLQTRGYFADGLHGDMKQVARTRVMNTFKSGMIDILVATDVAARGIDVDDVEAVFNYDIPQDDEYYVHRIGRTGRAGRAGRAFTFVTGRKQIYALKDIQRYTKSKIHLQQAPSISDVEENKTNKFIEETKAVIEEGELNKYIKIVDRLIEDDYTSVDIAAALIKMSMGKGKDNGKKWEEDLFGDSGAEPGMVRLFINIGKNQKVSARHIVGAIAGETGLQGNLIGSIDVFDKYTFVEVPKENAKEVLLAMKNGKIKGKKINIEPAKGKDRR